MMKPGESLHLSSGWVIAIHVEYRHRRKRWLTGGHVWDEARMDCLAYEFNAAQSGRSYSNGVGAGIR